MSTRPLTLISTAGSLLLSAATLAQEHGGAVQTNAIANSKEGFYTAITAIVVFLIVLAVLSFVVWPIISKSLDERANKIKDEIEGAELARQQAKDALEQYQQSLAQARAEAQKEIDKARSQAQIIAAELKAKADVELNAMREKAMRDIDNAKKAAVSEIYSHSTQLATTMAGKILRREVNSGDTQRLLDESVAQLSGSRN